MRQVWMHRGCGRLLAVPTGCQDLAQHGSGDPCGVGVLAKPPIGVFWGKERGRADTYSMSAILISS